MAEGSPAYPVRVPFFCSGCPHNTSTRVPEGSRAMAGIGCHFMSVWMGRNTSTYSQMGGEGVAWLGQAPFTLATNRAVVTSASELGIEAPHARVYVGPCIAGHVGAVICTSAHDRGWVKPGRDSRALGISAEGRRAFAAVFGLDMAAVEATRRAPASVAA